MKVCIIGAGPAGLTAGYQLSKAIGGGRVTAVEIHEAEREAGGLSKSLRLWGQTVDLGPHRFFSTDARVNRFWLEIAGDRYAMVDRLTRIYYNGRFFFYPLRPFNALANLGPLEAGRCLASYLKQKIAPVRPDGSFEAWTTRRFGRRLYEIFFRTYSERLWGIPCTELDADFAAQRIRKLSLYGAVKNALVGGRGNPHKTLVDQFAYPCGGTGSFYQRMADAFRRNGGSLHLGSPVRSVLMEGGRVTGIQLEDGARRDCDAVISTMPLSFLVDRLPGVPDAMRCRARELRYRNTILVFLEIGHAALFPDQWLYIHSPGIAVGRITNFRNWHSSLYGDSRSSILCLEYWCDGGDEFWRRPDAEIAELAARELETTGLNRGCAVANACVHRIPRSYPVYFRGYREALRPLEEYLASVPGLQAIGRNGGYKYNNQDHSILMGLLAAENVAEGARHNLWAINTDYEDYQEASVITRTGLAPGP